MRRLFVAGLAVAVSGCLSVPVAETSAMVAATDAVASASDILIGQLNAAEKRNRLNLVSADPNAFIVGNAPLYSTLDTFAPDTAKFKAAIDILKNYAGLIRSMVDGRGASEGREQLNKIIGNLNTLGLIAPEYSAAIAAFSPLIERARLVRSRAEARDLVARGRPAIAALIDALRNGTPAMFHLLIAASFAEGPNSSFDREKARVALSNYVILLDRLQDAFDRLADAFANPSNTMTLATLAQATGELVATAKIVQQGLAALK